jgi:GntR family transcriptional regulator
VEGIVQRIQGKGTVVASPRIHFPLKSPNGFSSILAAQGLRVHSVILSSQQTGGDARANAVFGTGTERQDNFIEFRRLRYVNHVPVVLLSSVVPRELGEKLLRFELADASFYKLFEQITGYPIVRSEETLEIGQVNENEARLLQVPVNSSHFLIRGTSYRQGEIPLETTVSIFHANFFRFQIDMRQVVLKKPVFDSTLEGKALEPVNMPT